jgi:DNA invertase Pin-like site-specific DNA recombinase
MNKSTGTRSQIHRDKAVAYIVFPDDTRYGEPDLSKKTSISTQRKTIEITAQERGWNIVHEFAVPKKANRIDSPEFRELVEYVERHNVNTVAIYRGRIHRNATTAALMEATLMRVGARVVSIQHAEEDIPAQIKEFLRAFAAFDTLTRREDQLRSARKRRQRAADAA